MRGAMRAYLPYAVFFFSSEWKVFYICVAYTFKTDLYVDEEFREKYEMELCWGVFNRKYGQIFAVRGEIK